MVSQALTRMVIEDNSHNIPIIQAWIEKWHPVAAVALQAFAPIFEGKLKMLGCLRSRVYLKN